MANAVHTGIKGTVLFRLACVTVHDGLFWVHDETGPIYGPFGSLTSHVKSKATHSFIRFNRSTSGHKHELQCSRL